jgi:uncharacterized protein
MDLREIRSRDRPPIEAYGNGGFRVGGAFHAGSLLLLPRGVAAWSPTRVEDITEESLEPLRAVAESIDFVLIGTGRTMRPLPASVRNSLAAAGLGIEFMDTGAACRTYNVLVAEERRVAAALIAVE